MFLDLELASPYLLSGAASEPFDIVVMTHLDDGVRSLAIDEFPEMTDDAIERFWIEKVERHRAAREAAFAKLELEAVALEADAGCADAYALRDARHAHDGHDGGAHVRDHDGRA